MTDKYKYVFVICLCIELYKTNSHQYCGVTIRQFLFSVLFWLCSKLIMFYSEILKYTDIMVSWPVIVLSSWKVTMGVMTTESYGCK